MGAGGELGIETAGDAEADDAAAAGLDCRGQRFGHDGSAAAAHFRVPHAQRQPFLEIEADRDHHIARPSGHMPNATLRLLVFFKLRNRPSAHSGKNFG